MGTTIEADGPAADVAPPTQIARGRAERVEVPMPPVGPAADGRSDRRPTIPHVPALDGLRGTAVAGVLAYHLGLLDGGYLGVDLFFVLSGFLITSLLLAEVDDRGQVSLRAFWARRMRRLLPALLLLLVGVALYARTVAAPIDLPTIRADALATVGYVANWRTILHGASYWDTSLAPSPLQHTWSLAIEEQFYVLWPLLFVLLARRARRRSRSLATSVLWVAALGALASAATLVWLHAHGASDTRVYEGTDTRAAALLLGVALAAWRARVAASPFAVTSTARRPGRAATRSVAPLGPRARRARTVEVFGIGAACTLGFLWVRLGGQSPWVYRGGLAVASVLAVVVVAAAARPSSPVLGRALAFAPLRKLGVISYGLYLWHWPIFQALDARNGRLPGLGDRVLGHGQLVVAKVVLSLAAALVSHVLIEQPIRHGRLRRPLAPIAAAFGAVAATAAVLFATVGGVHVDHIAPLTAKPAATVRHAPTVVVAGDSVALSIASRFYANPARYGLNPVDHTRIACSVVETGHPVRSFAGQPIRPASCQEYALRGLAAAKPDVVLLVVGARPNDSIQIDGEWVGACDPAFDIAYREAELDLVRRFRATGAQVVIGTVLHSSHTSFRVERAEAHIECVNRVIRSIPRAVDGVHVVDANELVCPDPTNCIEEIDGEPVRSDGIHYDRGPGGDRVADWLAAQILDLTGFARPQTTAPPG